MVGSTVLEFGRQVERFFACTLPWAAVFVPVAFLFVQAMAVSEKFGVVVDFWETAFGASVFLAGFVFMAWKHERAVKEGL